MLVLLVQHVTRTGAVRSPRLQSGSWASAFALFAYAVAFSYAYVALDTGVGALILFACVQATMIGWSLKEGDRPSPLEWLGLIVAFARSSGWYRRAWPPGSARGSGDGGVRDRLGRLFAQGPRTAGPTEGHGRQFHALDRLRHPALRLLVLMAQLPVHASANGGCWPLPPARSPRAWAMRFGTACSSGSAQHKARSCN
jgi:hypothetical protein